MKIVLVNHSDSAGGASVVTMRLMLTLRSLGVDARMLVTSMTNEYYKDVALLGNRLSRKWKFLYERGVIFLNNGFNRSDLFKVSIADTGFDVTRHPWVKEADVVMLNWINQGVMSLADIRRLASVKPVIWTMHDMWCMTGACHHALDCRRFRNDCGRCPYFGEKRDNDLSRTIWLRKKKLYETAGIHFVAVSNWVEQRARESSLLRDSDITVIPNAFPVNEFIPDWMIVNTLTGKEIHVSDLLRCNPRFAGVDFDRQLIMMGAARLDDSIKGLDYAIDALNMLAERSPETAKNAQAVFFGDIRNPRAFERLRFPYAYIGRVADRSELAELYSSAAVVLSTSLYETLPGTLIEGQAAGCVPVSFDRGGQSDIIDHMKNGYLARFPNVADVARGIEWALNCGVPRQSLHDSVAARFSAPVIARRYIDLCNEIRK